MTPARIDSAGSASTKTGSLYLQVFARIGCQEVAIPYDITKISTIADDLESSWQKILLLFESETKDKK